MYLLLLYCYSHRLLQKWLVHLKKRQYLFNANSNDKVLYIPDCTLNTVFAQDCSDSSYCLKKSESYAGSTTEIYRKNFKSLN